MSQKTIECRTCAYWQPPGEDAYEISAKRGVALYGQCRRNAPELTRTDGGFRGMWPTTQERQWCGEHADVVREAAPEGAQ